MVLTRPSNGQRPTLEDVARRSGVSKSTVSRVINAEPRVRAEVVERVREVIAELGYVPNQAARQLVTHRTGAVAVVAAQPENRLFLDPFFDRLLRGIRRELARHGAQAVLLFLDEPDDYPRVADYLGGGHVDGALLFSLRPGDLLPEMVDRLGLPAVFGGRPLLREGDTVRGQVYVDGDNRGGARQAVRHLVALGRTRIATVTGPYDQENSAADRLAGYRDALPEAASPLVERADYTQRGGADAMAALLDRCPGLDAVFVASDLMASGALQTLRERGRRVPEDVAVVGFDDLTEIAESTDPPLTTVHQDVEEMGRLMARLLLDRTRRPDTPAAAPAIVPTRLVRRKSA
ncbi:LacI family DNA-binding transcriptional regulator [Streptomyces sp. ALI-76-A]|jgi:DNA-binding LacI/PurR family transcriptional regulator|uniref:LacI family DNA-binding transcriptional regulator n=1 Tax=Streptomyces sp. ALI-76-A TaxID=3025736 RepID=UPI00256F5E87|nr:LacI family DNA-binding transcriptional regulator [Streptomyces sp. ALI-76-A]MDL5201822.1 LacI family DNA-binding transcriptional regulator [Streptomyces sp. ALI-76-A]